jgi:hypothetical protein
MRPKTQGRRKPDWTDLVGEDTIAEMAAAAALLLDAETFSASTRLSVGISQKDSRSGC